MARRAFLVAINDYKVSKWNLRGCVNDAVALKRILEGQFQFEPQHIAMLLNEHATRAAIIAGLTDLLAAAHAGDKLVFMFSGHGTQKLRQADGEDDSKDECIVPYEINYDALISDDELFSIISPAITPGIKFTAIYDCCHSGTLVRETEIDENGEFIDSVLNRCVFLPDLAELQTRPIQIGPYNVLSACKDDETAADLRSVGERGEARGAFSYSLHQVIQNNNGISFGALETPVLASIRQVSPRHAQEPQYVLVNPSRSVFD